MVKFIDDLKKTFGKTLQDAGLQPKPGESVGSKKVREVKLENRVRIKDAYQARQQMAQKRETQMRNEKLENRKRLLEERRRKYGN